MKRVGLVVHPTREIDKILAILRDWTAERGIELVQLRAGSHDREVAPLGEVQSCDLVVAAGGDGTVLAALRATDSGMAPVLGVACGSLGALAAVTAGDLGEALESYESGDWTRRRIPALEVKVDGDTVEWALNDFVVVRRAGQQLTAEVAVGGELFVRMAGDGVIVATALGSSAYSMGAGGPILAAGMSGCVVTPLTMHGGSAPPLVVPAQHDVVLDVHPGFGGFDVEIDGQTKEIDATTFELTLIEERATLVGIGDPGVGITPLRRRGLIADSPRMLARDERARVAARAAAEPRP